MMQDEKADGLRRNDRTPLTHDRQTHHGLGTQTQKRIGTHLRALYDQVVQQPIPDRFRDLIDRLDDDQGRKT